MRQIKLLQTHCSDFISESKGLPLLKALPSTYADFQRVKVRRSKKIDPVGEVFNQAFSEQYNHLRQRAVYASATAPILESDQELYYVFPVNGYKYLYSREVQNSSVEYQQVLDTLVEQFDNTETATNVVTDLLVYSYNSTELYEGLSSGSELIVYNIPYFFAVKAQQFPNYKQLINI